MSTHSETPFPNHYTELQDMFLKRYFRKTGESARTVEDKEE